MSLPAMTYNFLARTEAATKAVEQYLGRSLTWQQLPDGRYLTQLEPMDHWKTAKHSGIEGIDPYGNPDPDSDNDIFTEMGLPSR